MTPTCPSPLNQRPFYLSHHSEIMASKSVSKVHRRQDRVLREEHLNFMNTNTKIPVKSSRAYANVLGARRATVNEVQAPKATTELPARSMHGLSTTVKIPDATQGTDLVPQAQSRRSTLAYTQRSRSIAPRSTQNTDPSGLEDEDRDSVAQQGLTPFLGLAIPVPAQTFHASGSEDRSHRFRGFRQSGAGWSAR